MAKGNGPSRSTKPSHVLHVREFLYHPDTLRPVLYKAINGDWQNYEQGIMHQSHLTSIFFINTHLDMVNSSSALFNYDK